PHSRTYLASLPSLFLSLFLSFNDPAPTEIYTLSLHDALPISGGGGGLRRAGRAAPAFHARPRRRAVGFHRRRRRSERGMRPRLQDRKSTRLNSSHLGISYAVFCLKKKKKYKVIKVSRLDGYL